jgi:hypothetical protein
MKKHNKPGQLGFPQVRLLVIGAGGWPQAFAQSILQRLRLSPVTRPPQRQYHSLAFDSKRGITVLFGGLTIEPIDQMPLPYGKQHTFNAVGGKV